MVAKQGNQTRVGLWSELRMTLQRGRQVWRLVPRRHQWALFGAAFLMGVTSLVNTAIPLFLGNLVDGVRVYTEQPEPRPRSLPCCRVLPGTARGRLPVARGTPGGP